MPPSPLDSLIDLVRRATESPEALMERAPAIAPALQELTLDDLGVRHVIQRAWSMRSHQWFSHSIAAEARFHIDVFVLPRGALIPLHDHPAMNVWLRVLEGTPRVRAFHPVEAAERGWLTALDYDRILTPDSDALVITPDRGSVHSVHGAWDVVSAFIDVSAPPYDEASGRGCTYFVEGPTVTRDGRALVHLTRGE